MEKELKFNQCQDCGCPGAQILIEQRLDGTMAAACPYCKRRSDFLKVDVVKDDLLDVFVRILNNWNSHNRENKEGLA